MYYKINEKKLVETQVKICDNTLRNCLNKMQFTEKKYQMKTVKSKENKIRLQMAKEKQS